MIKLRSESREIRPYLGVEGIQDALEDVQLCIGDAVIDHRGRAVVSTQSYLRDRVALRFGTSDEDAELFDQKLNKSLLQAGLEASDVDILLLLSTSRLKMSDIAWSCSAKDLGELKRTALVASGENRPRPLQTPFGQCSAQLFVLLNRQLKRQPLRPWRKGTWLGRARFQIATELGEIGFTPIRLDQEQRERLGLPDHTLRYAEVESPLDPEIGPEAVTLYVDEDLLTEMVATPYTSGARSLQRQLFLDAMRAVIYEARRELAGLSSPSLDEIEGSILWKLLCRTAGVSSPPPASARPQLEDLIAQVSDQPELLLARVESWMPDLKKNLVDSITEGR